MNHSADIFATLGVAICMFKLVHIHTHIHAHTHTHTQTHMHINAKCKELTRRVKWQPLKVDNLYLHFLQHKIFFDILKEKFNSYDIFKQEFSL